MKAECGNCKFYKDDGRNDFKEGWGWCLRFPEKKRTHDGRYCGEHTPVEASK